MASSAIPERSAMLSTATAPNSDAITAANLPGSATSVIDSSSGIPSQFYAPFVPAAGAKLSIRPDDNTTVARGYLYPSALMNRDVTPFYPGVMNLTENEPVEPPRKLSCEELTTRLEELLSRDAVLNHKDPLITYLIFYTASPDLSVPVECLLLHPRLAGCTSDEILDAAENSDILSIDQTRNTVIPQLRAKRSTLIIREAKPSVTPKDILTLLSSCPDVAVNEAMLVEEPLDVSKCCTSIISLVLRLNSWFLTFNAEDLTESVAWWLRSQKLQGDPVQVRIKTESALRLDLIPAMSSPPRLGGRPIRRWRGNSPKLHGGRWTSSTICKACSLQTGEGGRCICQTNGVTPDNNKYFARGGANGRRQWRRVAGGRGDVRRGRNFNATVLPPCRIRPPFCSLDDRVLSRPNNRQQRGTPSLAPAPTSEKIVVVTPSEFPPLCEAVKVKPNCGYPGPDFRQHSMEQVRDICEKLSTQNMRAPLVARRERLVPSEDIAAVFEENGPRQHKWCFDVISKKPIPPKPLARPPTFSKSRDGVEPITAADLLCRPVDLSIKPSTNNNNNMFWARKNQKQKDAAVGIFASSALIHHKEPRFASPVLGETFSSSVAPNRATQLATDSTQAEVEQTCRDLKKDAVVLPTPPGQVNFVVRFGSLVDKQSALATTTTASEQRVEEQ